MEQEFLRKLTEITEAHIGDPHFGVDELASEMNMSHSSLLRRLHAINGKSINQFIREIRLWKAMELMQQDGKTASEVAHLTGFSSPAYFSNCFHEFFGYPPGDVKKMAVHEIIPASLPKSSVRKKKWGEIAFATTTVTLIILFFIIFINILSGSNENRVTNARGQVRSVAVLPFEDWGARKSPPSVVFGFKLGLLNNLSEIKSLRVVSDFSTEQYRNSTKTEQMIGKELRVDYLVKGAIGNEGDQFKMWVYLIEVKTGRQIWSSDTIWKSNSDLFTAQGEITKNIARQLKAKISPEEFKLINTRITENQEALKQYERGQYFSDGSNGLNIPAAMEAYRKAFELDPLFTDAYLGLANIYITAHAMDLASYQESVPIIDWCIRKVRSINPKNREIAKVLADYHFTFRNYELAIAEYDSLLKDDPTVSGYHSQMAKAYRNLGNWDQALNHFLKALELRQNNQSICIQTGLTYDMLRNFPEAIKYFDKVTAINANDPFSVLYKADISVKWEGDTRKASALLTDYTDKVTLDNYDIMHFIYRQVWLDFYEGEYEKALEKLAKCEFKYFPNNYFMIPVPFMYAMTYGFLNKPELERSYWDSTYRWIEQTDSTFPNDPRMMSTLGVAFAGLGKSDKAIELGEKALEISQQKPNAIGRTYIIENLAYIYTVAGKYPEALINLRYLLDNPSRMTPRLLLMDPRWEPLRKLDGFKKITRISI